MTEPSHFCIYSADSQCCSLNVFGWRGCARRARKNRLWHAARLLSERHAGEKARAHEITSFRLNDCPRCDEKICERGYANPTPADYASDESGGRGGPCIKSLTRVSRGIYPSPIYTRRNFYEPTSHGIGGNVFARRDRPLSPSFSLFLSTSPVRARKSSVKRRSLPSDTRGVRGESRSARGTMSDARARRRRRREGSTNLWRRYLRHLAALRGAAAGNAAFPTWFCTRVSPKGRS